MKYKKFIINLSSTSYLVVIKQFYQINNNYQDLWNLIPERDTYIKIYGKEIKIPRKQDLFSNDDRISYKYSGTIVKSKPIIENSILSEIYNYFINYKLVKSKNKKDFNAIFINWYRNGKDYINQHSDDEKDLDIEKGIWSLSFGATRTFIITCKKTQKTILELKLSDGMLIGMCGNFQKEFKHGIPKEKTNETRINLTFRSFVR